MVLCSSASYSQPRDKRTAEDVRLGGCDRVFGPGAHYAAGDRERHPDPQYRCRTVEEPHSSREWFQKVYNMRGRGLVVMRECPRCGKGFLTAEAANGHKAVCPENPDRVVPEGWNPQTHGR